MSGVYHQLKDKMSVVRIENDCDLNEVNYNYMGLLNKLFGSNSDANLNNKTKELPWIALQSKNQLEEIDEKSSLRPQIIFKHSTRCGISRMVMNQFVASYDTELNADLYYLDLLSYREVSDEVGYKFQVMHQSPQLIIVNNGETVAHASHGAINEIDLKRFA